jgi:hypothetical protein
MIASEKTKTRNKMESPDGLSGLRNIMDPMTGGHVPLDLNDLGPHDTDAGEQTEEMEGREKSSPSPLCA